MALTFDCGGGVGQTEKRKDIKELLSACMN